MEPMRALHLQQPPKHQELTSSTAVFIEQMYAQQECKADALASIGQPPLLRASERRPAGDRIRPTVSTAAGLVTLRKATWAAPQIQTGK